MNVADRDRYKSLRTEFNRQSFKKILRQVKPPICVNCGTTEGVCYHHVVALEFGGTNNIDNIVPLCRACHTAVHYSNHIVKYGKIGKNPGGRPRKAVLNEETEEILWSWANGNIGASECMKSLGYITKGTHLKDTPVYKEFIKKHGIQNIRNKIDIIVAKNGILEPGRQVSTIYYMDGEREFGYYNPMP